MCLRKVLSNRKNEVDQKVPYIALLVKFWKKVRFSSWPRPLQELIFSDFSWSLLLLKTFSDILQQTVSNIQLVSSLMCLPGTKSYSKPSIRLKSENTVAKSFKSFRKALFTEKMENLYLTLLNPFLSETK